MKKFLIGLTLVSTLAVGGVTYAKTVKHPAGAMAMCRDNTYSYSANHRGTCSHHKGVKIWYR